MLWNRQDLSELRVFSRDPGYVTRALPNGDRIQIERWMLRFPQATPDRLIDSGLSKTYTVKPLLAPYGEGLFGELAILRCLELNGWSGAWADTFHGRELFWRDLPFPGNRVDLSSAQHALDLYRRIVAAKGTAAGFFDVFAWKDSDYLFIEYKGEGDKPNANETLWIGAALSEGIDAGQLLFAVGQRVGS